jgi:hypothetical protein
MAQSLEQDLEKVLGAVTKLFASDGDERAVAILAMSKARIEQTEYDRWEGGQYGYTVYLEVPQSLYEQIGEKLDEIEEGFRNRVASIQRLYVNEWISKFIISTELVVDPKWRERVRAWVNGQGVTNQGRVRSDNPAPRLCDGLFFRSEPEIHLYRALRSAGVAVAPLPVFVRGGETYRRIEPDFVIIKDGVVLVVEVDGDTVHRESPQQAHDRLTMLAHEGAHIERVNAQECSSAESAKKCAQRILALIAKLRSNK